MYRVIKNKNKKQNACQLIHKEKPQFSFIVYVFYKHYRSTECEESEQCWAAIQQAVYKHSQQQNQPHLHPQSSFIDHNAFIPGTLSKSSKIITKRQMWINLYIFYRSMNSKNRTMLTGQQSSKQFPNIPSSRFKCSRTNKPPQLTRAPLFWGLSPCYR